MAEPKYRPLGMSLALNAKIATPGELTDGSFDFNDVLQGRLTRRVSADYGRDKSKPNACLFICQCRHVRRIIFDNEHNFTCENPNGGCNIFWKMRLVPGGLSESGDQMYVPLVCKHDESGACDHAEELPFKHEPGMPVIDGYDIQDIRRESRAAKIASGEMTPQPQPMPQIPVVVPDLKKGEDEE